MDDYDSMVFWHRFNLEDAKDNNLGDLQNLFDQGWNVDFSGDEVVHKSVVYVMFTLIKKKFSE